MRAYYELETNIPLNHQITIQLPDNIPVGQATIAVIYESNQKVANNPPQSQKLTILLLKIEKHGKIK